MTKRRNMSITLRNVPYRGDRPPQAELNEMQRQRLRALAAELAPHADDDDRDRYEYETNGGVW